MNFCKACILKFNTLIFLWSNFFQHHISLTSLKYLQNIFLKKCAKKLRIFYLIIAEMFIHPKA